MNEVWLELFNNLRALHLRKIACERNVIVERKGEALRVSDAVSKGLFWKLLGGSLGVDRENVHFVASLAHELIPE